jgi:hypothetical protein
MSMGSEVGTEGGDQGVKDRLAGGAVGAREVEAQQDAALKREVKLRVVGGEDRDATELLQEGEQRGQRGAALGEQGRAVVEEQQRGA